MTILQVIPQDTTVDVIRSTPILDSVESTILQDTLQVRAFFDAQYLEFLEKTNDQLNFWVNSLGVIITALGVVVAVGAIAAVVIIRRQGSDHKKLLLEGIQQQGIENKKLLDEGIYGYRVVIDELMGDARKEIRDGLDQDIAGLREEQKSAKKEDKEEIEKRIEVALDKREKVASLVERLSGPADSLSGVDRLLKQVAKAEVEKRGRPGGSYKITGAVQCTRCGASCENEVMYYGETSSLLFCESCARSEGDS